jgi:hypothetical protein
VRDRDAKGKTRWSEMLTQGLLFVVRCSLLLLLILVAPLLLFLLLLSSSSSTTLGAYASVKETRCGMRMKGESESMWLGWI